MAGTELLSARLGTEQPLSEAGTSGSLVKSKEGMSYLVSSRGQFAPPLTPSGLESNSQSCGLPATSLCLLLCAENSQVAICLTSLPALHCSLCRGGGKGEVWVKGCSLLQPSWVGVRMGTLLSLAYAHR